MISAFSNLPHKFNPKARQAIWDRFKISPSVTMSRNSKDVAVNAKITDKNFDMPTKWNLMSELKKQKIKSDVGRLL